VTGNILGAKPLRRAKTALALFIVIPGSFVYVIVATFVVAKMQLYLNKNVTGDFFACHAFRSTLGISPDLSVGYPIKTVMKIRVVTTR
jgi:hypothetical protein